METTTPKKITFATWYISVPVIILFAAAGWFGSKMYYTSSLEGSSTSGCESLVSVASVAEAGARITYDISVTDSERGMASIRYGIIRLEHYCALKRIFEGTGISEARVLWVTESGDDGMSSVLYGEGSGEESKSYYKTGPIELCPPICDMPSDTIE